MNDHYKRVVTGCLFLGEFADPPKSDTPLTQNVGMSVPMDDLFEIQFDATADSSAGIRPRLPGEAKASH